MLPSDRRKLRESVRARCDADGIDEVRNKLARHAYSGQKRGIAEEWVAEKLAEQQDAKQAAEREIDRDIARGANRRATWANVISIVALVVAVVALFTG